MRSGCMHKDTTLSQKQGDFQTGRLSCTTSPPRRRFTVKPRSEASTSYAPKIVPANARPPQNELRCAIVTARTIRGEAAVRGEAVDFAHPSTFPPTPNNRHGGGRASAQRDRDDARPPISPR